MTFDPSKPCQTRDGRPVEIITTKGRGPKPIIGYIGNNERTESWDSNGNAQIKWGIVQTQSDLINVPEPKSSGKVWVNVYKNKEATAWSTKEMANEYEGNYRIACIGPIKWTEGEGLEK